MSDKTVLLILELAVIIFIALSVLRFRRNIKNKEQAKSARKEELDKFFKMEINPVKRNGYLKTIEVIVTLPKGEECYINVTDDLYGESKLYYSRGYQPSFKSLGEQKIVEDNGTIIKISQLFEIKSTTRSRVCGKIGDCCETIAKITEFIQPD